MATQTDIDRAPARMRSRVVIVLVATVLVASLSTFFGAQRYFQQVEGTLASNRMVLYLRDLNGTLRQHQHLPFVLARDPRYTAELTPEAVAPQTNQRLQLLAQEAKLEAIYLLDSKGIVLATSNAGQPNSFLGQNYGFRPYFKQALAGKRSDYFAIGATSGRPGYFVAEPALFASGKEPGVIALKIDVSELQRSWENTDETVIAINRDNIVVLASKPDWLYRPISALSPDLRDEILRSRQFGKKELEPLDWSQTAPSRIVAEGTAYVAASGRADWRGWTVIYLRPEAHVTRQTLAITVLFGSVIAVLVGFATFLRSRRIALAYAASERQRGALMDANLQLEQAQTDLAQSAKLAALGQLAASVTHELGQPISAFRNHLAAAEIGGEITSPSTAASLNRLVARMETITGQLRFFAGGRVEEKKVISVVKTISDAQEMLRADIARTGVNIQVSAQEEVTVLARPVQLEQVFINLLKNAVHAVSDVETPEIAITITSQQDEVRIAIADNGTGLGEAHLKDLQEPFYSTKPSGVGMGLGLAITSEIIKDHDGTLSATSSIQRAEFVVTLPTLQTGEL